MTITALARLTAVTALAVGSIGAVTAPAAVAEDLPPAVVCTYTVDQPDGWGGTRAFTDEDMFEGSTWLKHGQSIRAYRDFYSEAYGKDLRLRRTTSGQLVVDDYLTRQRNCTHG
ncbi:hypothetical protein [Actinomycetospora soli]|uniref:hypothetical protein n=1 Tax=Actinomycetospora soli TaxID=2893887 RepID=UPI001E29C312|nr:hypothetical protein [Actinomycetospora soli]MCD2191239.1 hypothetical protein [Actinomycetospora soli]